jgi:hypothetical protein
MNRLGPEDYQSNRHIRKLLTPSAGDQERRVSILAVHNGFIAPPPGHFTHTLSYR